MKNFKKLCRKVLEILWKILKNCNGKFLEKLRKFLKNFKEI